MASVAATTRIRRAQAWAILLGLFVLQLPLESTAQDTPVMPIAIVVHKDSSIDDLSLQELRNIFLANQQFWPDRTRITLMMRAPKSDERDFVLDRIYQMDEAQFRQYWIAKMFRAEVPSGPKIVFSNDMALALVIAIPGSISFIKSNEVTDEVRLVKVDGKLPGDEGYPLK